MTASPHIACAPLAQAACHVAFLAVCVLGGAVAPLSVTAQEARAQDASAERSSAPEDAAETSPLDRAGAARGPEAASQLENADAVEPIGVVIEDGDGDTRPDRLGEMVVVAGRVTAGTGQLRTDVAEVYIQDATGGLRLMLPPRAPRLYAGDSLRAEGRLTQRNGAAELVDPAFTVFPVPPRQVRSRAVDTHRGQWERWEGRIVKATGTVVAVDSTDGGTSAMLLIDGELLQVFSYPRSMTAGAVGTLERGVRLHVTGILTQHDEAAPFDASYVLLPLAPDFITRAGVPPSVYRWVALGVAGALGLALLWVLLLRRQVNHRTRELRASTARYEHLLDAAGDPVFVSETQGDYPLGEVNQAARRRFGLQRNGRREGAEEEAAKRSSLVYLTRSSRRARQHLRTAAQRGHALDRLHLLTDAGLVIPFEVSTHRLRLPGGLALVSIARDVSSQEAYEDGLIEAREAAEAAQAESEKARREAEEAARLKSAILANMSHEIRTPLTAILGYAQLLEEESPPDLAEMARVVHSGGTRLMNTLNSVLDFARLDATHETLHAEPFDAAEVVRETADLLRPLADDKELLLMTEAPPTLEVTHSRQALERVLANLVGNAVKFTQHGGVRVRLTASGGDVNDAGPAGREASPTHFDVVVQDTGIGMSEDFLERVFEPFVQESEGQARSHEGTGLGLAITKRLVEDMGGTISLQSRKGVGTRFVLRFPMEQPPMEQPPMEQPLSEEPSGAVSEHDGKERTSSVTSKRAPAVATARRSHSEVPSG